MLTFECLCPCRTSQLRKAKQVSRWQFLDAAQVVGDENIISVWPIDVFCDHYGALLGGADVFSFIVRQTSSSTDGAVEPGWAKVRNPWITMQTWESRFTIFTVLIGD